MINKPTIRAPLILIEGPDRSGKTMLADAIGRVGAPAIVIHGHMNNDNPVSRPNNERLMMEYHARILAAAMEKRSKGMAVILDRHWLSHMAYGAATNMLRAGALFTYRSQFEPMLNALHAFYVITVDPSCIELSLKNPSSPYPKSRELLERILSAYSYELRVLMSRPSPRCLAYHWSSHGATQDKLDDFARLVLSLAVEPPSTPITDGPNGKTYPSVQ